jgi:phosphohistidine phosphatase SixA
MKIALQWKSQVRLHFIRHGIAEERQDFAGPDMQRPLSSLGIERTELAFQGLCRVQKIEHIFSSQAERALMTAKLLGKIYGLNVVKEKLLNPGMAVSDLQTLIDRSKGKDLQDVAIVGHEPDFSLALAELCGADIVVKKASCIVLDTEQMALLAHYPPAALRRIAML